MLLLLLLLLKSFTLKRQGQNNAQEIWSHCL